MSTHEFTRAERVARMIAFMRKNRHASGVQLAAHFGISPRQTYRDMAAIMDAGLPVLSLSNGYKWHPEPGDLP